MSTPASPRPKLETKKAQLGKAQSGSKVKHARSTRWDSPQTPSEVPRAQQGDSSSAESLATVRPRLLQRDDRDATWMYIQRCVDQIMSMNIEGLDMQKYMGMYTAVHNYCSMNRLSEGRNPGGRALYANLVDYLTHHLSHVRSISAQHHDEKLLSFFVEEWARYKMAALYLNHMFRYFNRHWVRQEIEQGRKNVYKFFDLCMLRWKMDVFDMLHEKAMESVLYIIEKQRNGECVGYSGIRRFIDSFISISLDDPDTATLGLTMYKERFEKPLCTSTWMFYKRKSARFLVEHSVVEYMIMAEARLTKEERSVPLLLLNTLMGNLIKSCEEALICDHIGILHDEFPKLLYNNDEDQLSRIYRLLARVPGGLDPLRGKFEDFVQRVGLDAVNSIPEEDGSVDVKIFVYTLSDVLTRFENILAASFKGEAGFGLSLQRACRRFVNWSKWRTSRSCHSAEILARRTDALLLQSYSTTFDELDMERSLRQIITVLRYIEDKDIFQKFYSRMFARRLLHPGAVSEDVEKFMISKLKESCDARFSAAMQRMLQEMKISRDLNTSFKEWQSNAGVAEYESLVDASYSVLHTGSWPVSLPSTAFTPPTAIFKDCERFTEFYQSIHEGRKLSWLWQFCKGEIQANYVKLNGESPYIFQATVYQMAILLLFNENDKMSYDDIESSTCLATKTLVPSLGALVKGRVLHPHPGGAKPGKGVFYSINYEFKSNKLKNNLNIVIKSQQKQESEDTRIAIREDRKRMIQCTIVRLMKWKKKMSSKQLISETAQILQSRFSPETSALKECISHLAETEFLERLDDSYLGYLA